MRLLQAILTKTSGGPSGLRRTLQHAVRFVLPELTEDAVLDLKPRMVQDAGQIEELPFDTCYFELPSAITTTAVLLDSVSEVAYIFIPIVDGAGIRMEEIGYADLSFHESLGANHPDYGGAAILSWLYRHYINHIMTNHHQLVPLICDETKNAKRARKGKKCFYSHYTLDLNLTKECAIRKYYEATGRGSPKRLHARRGHTRQLRSGKVVTVKGSWCGQKELGTITKDYRVVYEDTHERKQKR